MICGYQSATRNKGGIKAIELIAASDFLGCDYDSSLSCFTQYSLAEGAEFCNIYYMENSAYYKQTASLDRGHAKVTHELSFSLCDDSKQTLSFVDKVLSGKIKSVVAIVTDNNSESYLIGYSREFLLERPLKLVSLIKDTAYSLSSRPMTNIVFSAQDTRQAQQICIS